MAHSGHFGGFRARLTAALLKGLARYGAKSAGGGFMPDYTIIRFELQGTGMARKAGTMATGPDRAVMRAAAATIASQCRSEDDGEATCKR